MDNLSAVMPSNRLHATDALWGVNSQSELQSSVYLFFRLQGMANHSVDFIRNIFDAKISFLPKLVHQAFTVAVCT